MTSAQAQIASLNRCVLLLNFNTESVFSIALQQIMLEALESPIVLAHVAKPFGHIIVS
jgi:hypothetical protein